jgi:HD-GYP domain-containing protein (c-di-GMP phosphodiesterase class II)
MTSMRPHRAAMRVDDALEELRRCSGSQFDAQVVDAIERVVTFSASMSPGRA